MAGQTSVTQFPDVAVAGLLADSGIRYAISRINKLTAQVVTVTIASVVDSTDYTVTINGVPCTYTSDATATEAEINAGLLDAINNSSFNGTGNSFDVTAAQGATTATIVITADVAGDSFVYSVTATILTVALTTGNGGAVPFGVGVARGSEDNLARLPSDSGDTLLGITVLDQTEVNQLTTGTHEYDGDDVMSILRKGRIYVVPEDAVTVDGDVYVRVTASGANTQLGAIRSDNDSGNAIQLTGAVFQDSAGAGEFAIVEINKP